MARKKKAEEEDDNKYDVLVGFVHEFKFLTPTDLERLNGHPAEGRVYRILKDPQGYRIYIGRENNNEGLDGLYLGETLEGEYGRYTFKIEIVTPTNYLTLPIVSEDRSKVLDWVQSDNNDLWENLRKEESGESAVIRTGTDLLKILMRAESPNRKAPEPPRASYENRERALEASLTLLTHFKNKPVNELVALYDAMYGRILNTLEG